MTEIKMSNVREKLSKSREACPGLGEEVYALTDYMSKVANDELVPHGMVILLVLSMEDIKKGRNSFARAESKEIPEYLTNNKTQVLAQAVYVPQVIDAIADEDFAIEFRKICKHVLQFDPPKRDQKYDLKADLDGEYPECVKVAVNWWANAIVNPKFDSGDDRTNNGMSFLMTMVVNSKKSITKEQIDNFKKELANAIVEKINSSTNGECYLNVDYDPDVLLSTAAKNAGMSSTEFPWKTSMTVSKNAVSVLAGYTATWETLWKA